MIRHVGCIQPAQSGVVGAYAADVGIGNRIVVGVLSSPFHRLLSRSTALVRYSGRRSGRVITTPVQYARHGERVVVLVGRPATKQWWRNFDGGHDVEVRVAGTWLPMHGWVRRGDREPDTVAALLDAYLARFPKVAHRLPVDFEERTRQAVVIDCRPR